MKIYNIKGPICLLLLFCFVQEFQAQSNSGYRILRSNLGSAGSSKTIETSKGSYNVSQSIGQSSVIGTHSNNGYYLRQGYQQPMTNKIVVDKEVDRNLKAKVYPNPFINVVVISFSDTMFKDITVMVFDINGKTIHSQEFLPLQEVELRINDIDSGIYLLKVISGHKHFHTKLIKI